MRILRVEGPEQLRELRALFEESWTAFGFTPCFQNFGQELAALPGLYASPDGRLGIAWLDEAAAGCVALRRFDEQRAEVKRLYVRPAFRGRGVGKALIDWIMAEARAAGYREIVGDTLPVMKDALLLYDRMGFERSTGKGGIILLRMRLDVRKVLQP